MREDQKREINQRGSEISEPRLVSLWKQKFPDRRVTYESFAAEYGLGTAAYVGNVLHGRKPLHLRFALALSQALGISLSELSRDLDFQYRQMTAAARPSKGGPVTQNAASTTEYSGFPLASSKRLREIPVMNWTQTQQWINAGRRAPYLEGRPIEITHAYGDLTDDAIAIRLEGDSMAPHIPSGAVVIIDPWGQPQHGKYVLVETSPGDVKLRRLEIDGSERWLVAGTEKYPRIRVSEETTFAGVVRLIQIDA